MKISYTESTYNFGDLLNKNILEQLFDIQPIKTCQNIYDTDLFFIGSRLQRILYSPTELSFKEKIKRSLRYQLKSPVKVFGTGFIEEVPLNSKLYRKPDIIALRGKKTKYYFEKILGKKINNITFGDPGILCSELLKSEKKQEKKYSLGIVAHYVDKANPLLELIKSKNENSVILDIQQEPVLFMKKLVQCETVLSSAMHGLIAADSFHIPNLRMILSDQIIGGDFKYNDYYSIYNIEEHNKVYLNSQESVSENYSKLIKNQYSIPLGLIEETKTRLITSFHSRIKKEFIQE